MTGIQTLYMLVAVMTLPSGEFKYNTQFMLTEQLCNAYKQKIQLDLLEIKPYFSQVVCVPVKVQFPDSPERKS